MPRLISPEEMQLCEKRYFETSCVPSMEIMRRAAQALADTVLARFPDAQTIYIACGPGGNGGDGYACARLLKEKGKNCTIYASAPAKSADAIEYSRLAAKYGIKISPDELPLEAPDLWIDCLFGTGLSRMPEARAAELIQRMNRHRIFDTKIIAADIPSGLNGRTGKAYDPCVKADITIAFQFGKYGHFLQDGLDMCGEVITTQVGFPRDIFPEEMLLLIQPQNLRSALPRTSRNIHKGNCGHLLIVAGSVGMAGAAALCAKAALRSGVGLVTIACPESIVPILQIHAPCAMCVPLPEEKGVICANALPILLEALKGKHAVAIGPGLSRRAAPEIIQAVLECGLPAVIDADALNILAKNPQLQSLLRYRHIITPHPGEAARLLGRPCCDPIADAQALTGLGATAVLKGASRVIYGKEDAIISAAGGCGMARGGSGDVLTGLLGGMLAKMKAQHEFFDSSAVFTAAQACEIHGLAGELAQEKYGPHAMNAADIIEFLPEVFKRYVR